MFYIKNTAHKDVVQKIIEELQQSEATVCLKSEDGEKMFINKVLLSIWFPSLGSLITEENILDMTCISIPLEMRIIKMVLDIKVTGVINISDEGDVDKINEACSTLGEEIDADKLLNTISDDTKIDIKTEVESHDSTLDNPGKDLIERQPKRQREVGLKKERCNKCRIFSKRGSLKAHILECHTDSSLVTNDNNTTENDVKTEIVEAVKKERVITGRRCAYCKADLPRRSLIEHMKNVHPEREIFECELCGYECVIKSILVKHVHDSHTRDKTTCQYCDKEFKSIEVHIEKFHPEHLNKFSCVQCPFITFDDRRLKKHTRKQHESKRGYCGKCKKRVYDIEKHEKRHEFNKFECIPCNKNFSVRRDLCRHILYEHEKKRAACTVCGKTNVTNLKSHMKWKHPEEANSVEDDEREQRDRIAALLGEAWQYTG